MAKVSTTVNSSHVLLVEGEDDRGFFEQVCKLLKLNPAIKVALPKDYQEDYEELLRNGKQGALNLLDDLLVELLDETATTKRLAIIIDADYDKERGLGFEKTIEQVCNRVAEYDFSLAKNQTNGLVFKHESDEQIEFGLWVMPNNHLDGMFEDFIKTCVKTDERLLLAHVIQVINDLPDRKFKEHHLSKAEVATWLAWQEKPGHGLYEAIRKDLLDTNDTLFQELEQWLKKIFI